MWLNINIFSAFLTRGENHYAVDKSKESVVFTHSNILTRMVNSASLAFEDVTGTAVRPTEDFHTKSFTF